MALQYTTLANWGLKNSHPVPLPTQRPVVTQATLAILQLADPPSPEPRHDQVCDPPHEPAEYPEVLPDVQLFAVEPHTPLTGIAHACVLQL